MNRHRSLLSVWALLGLGAALLLAHGRITLGEDDARLAANRALVTSLGLTDLAVWTEARYTRHPSQTDFFSAFQDLPSGVEHFPAGSILATPPHLRARGGAGEAR